MTDVGVFIMSHRQTVSAQRLAEAFRPLVPTWLVDMGSPLTEDERAGFDRVLPNLYYVGALQEGMRWFDTPGRSRDDVLLVITGDVSVPDAAALVADVRQAMSNPRVGVYAPACRSGVRSMRHHPGANLRTVPFVEGYCFAARFHLLADLPLEPEVNRIGWGIDVYLGFLALRGGLVSVVDHRRPVDHPIRTGYAKRDARDQMNAWLARRPWPGRLFRFITKLPFAHSPLAAWAIVRLPWRGLGR